MWRSVISNHSVVSVWSVCGAVGGEMKELNIEASTNWETKLKLQKSALFSLFFNWGFSFVNECSWLLWRGKDSALGVTTRVTLFNSCKKIKIKNTLGLVGTCVASHFHFCNVLWLLISFILYTYDLDQTVLRAFTELNWSSPEWWHGLGRVCI